MADKNSDKKKDELPAWKDASLKEKFITVIVSAIALAAVSGIGGAFGLSKMGNHHDGKLEDRLDSATTQFVENKEDVCAWDAADLRVRNWQSEATELTRRALNQIKPGSEGIRETFKRVVSDHVPEKDVFLQKISQLADMGVGICFDEQLPPDIPSAYYPAERLITLDPQAPDAELARLLAFHLERLSGDTSLVSEDGGPVGLYLENNTAEPEAIKAPDKLPKAPLRARYIPAPV